jgi:nitrate/TMAO reductase-like tetraheme cytochrome c subunit
MALKRERGMTQVSRMILAAVLIAAVLVISGLYNWMSTPGFCNVCHPMSTRYAGWHRSTHANNATCFQCHSEPGLWGGIKGHAGGARYLWSIITNTRTRDVLKAEVGDETCMSCHDLKEIKVSFKAHDPGHDAHEKEGISCMECHDSVSHGELLGGPSRASMDTCEECHRLFDPAIAGCKACHPKPGLTINSTFVP